MRTAGNIALDVKAQTFYQDCMRIPEGVHEPAWLEIDLDAFESNIRAFKSHVGENVRLMPVVKGDAYGAGAVMCGRAAMESGADALAVIRVAEAVKLRQAGLSCCLVNLGFCTQRETGLLVEFGITQTIHRLDLAESINRKALSAHAVVDVHVNVDTGMSRSGLPFEDTPAFFDALKGMEGLNLTGVFTHFPTADCEDRSLAHEQLERFAVLRKLVKDLEFDDVLFHAANTGATIDLPSSHLDMVRPGIGVYGLYGSEHISRNPGLKQVASFRALVSHVKKVKAGVGVSYGHIYRAESDTVIATVQAGYADGVNRRLSNTGRMLLHGRRFPIAGRVTMDQTMLDLGDYDDVAVGDVATITGVDGGEAIFMDQLADSVGTIAHEIQCNIGPRVPRVYLRKKRVVAIARNEGIVEWMDGVTP